MLDSSSVSAPVLLQETGVLALQMYTIAPDFLCGFLVLNSDYLACVPLPVELFY